LLYNANTKAHDCCILSQTTLAIRLACSNKFAKYFFTTSNQAKMSYCLGQR